MDSLVPLELGKTDFRFRRLVLLDRKHLEVVLQCVDLLRHLLDVEGLHLLQDKLGHELLVLQRKETFN